MFGRLPPLRRRSERLEKLKTVTLEGFNQQNSLRGLTIRRTPDGYPLELVGNFGVEGKIEAQRVRIELEPGLPDRIADSLYSPPMVIGAS